ncbi:MAG: phage recombination protein Bet [Campylobacteraceae bacterium]|jgi:phage recombination protein Bet|nr:phage recombination protein Bet [Campylobacteraceae bacterium]
MSNEVRELAVVYKIDDNEVKLTPKIVQEYIVGSDSKITLPEFKFFTELCKVRKLNPFLKEAYLIKYGNQPAQIVVGKDAILKRAIKNPAFNGREQGIIVKNKNGIEERKGTFRLKDEELVGAWAKVYRKDWQYPVYITVSFDEVAQKKSNGELNINWATKSATMVEKVALVRALREAFVEDLGGMIDEDEAWTENAPRVSGSPVMSQPDAFEEPIEAEISLDEVV